MDSFDQLQQVLEAQGIHCTGDVLLRDYCTFKIGGPARLVVFPSSEEEIAISIDAAGQKKLPLLVLGRGSNILFADDGFPGVVLCLGSRFSRIEMPDEHTISCESGASLTQLCRYACDRGLSGLEFAYGIPGTVGGAIYMNAGAYGGEICDVLDRAHHLHINGVPGIYKKEQLELGYRHSVYTDSDCVITKGVFILTPGDTVDIQAKMEDFLGRRKEKQPIELPSAGSTFRRPRGAYASALIDRCGLKGLCVGGAQVSPKHAGFIVNTGGAVCKDVLELIERVQQEVLEKTGYKLECEVKLI